MNAFDKVIGYETIKNELLQICDMIHNREVYEELGAKLPSSLVRSGRFDRKIEVQCPTAKDADEIIKHYLSDKKVAENVDMDDLSKMISYSSCAELETILNEAAISAAHARKSSIEMDDL